LTVRYDRSLPTQFCRNIPLSPLPHYSILDTLLYVHKLNLRIEVYFWWFLLAFHSIVSCQTNNTLRRLCSVLLHVSEENMFCVTAHSWGNYVLCYCTYLGRLCSVLLHVSLSICVISLQYKHH
jgi:hypothetical protein